MYNYEEIKEDIDFSTAEAMQALVAIRDKTKEITDAGGAALMGTLMTLGRGDSWEAMAHVDRAVEARLIVEISGKDPHLPGQHRVFITR